MAVTTNIVRAWRAPRAVMREMLAMGQREDRALAFLMAGCLLMFVAQMPRLTRLSMVPGEAGQTNLDMLLSDAFYGWLLLMPFLFYGLAAAAHLLARLFGGGGSWFGARLALFWTLLAASPAALCHGLLLGLLGNSLATELFGVLAMAAFLWIFVQSLREAETRHAA